MTTITSTVTYLEFLLEGILNALNQRPYFLRSHSSDAQPLHRPSRDPVVLSHES